ncbi:MAG TPA: MFS transporter [Candidatus Saccharimonadales bacterium]|nr:MFS transporter [Candidatus Saccharimonadales bacterium]
MALPSPPAGRNWALATLSTILFLTFLDNTIVSVVLAGIQTDLNAGVQTLQWVVDSYMLVFAALMLTGGTLGDIFGRKKVMLGGVALFSVGSAIAMTAPSAGILTLGRIVMGVGAAASEPGTLSMIRHIYPDRQQRAQALGVWAAVSGVALAFGPIIGGAIVSAASWREIFTFNLIFGVAVFIAGLKVLPENADPQGRRLDIRGLLLGALALGMSTYAVIRGETAGYRTWWIVMLFILSAVTLLEFILHERRAADPVLKLKFFRKPAFTGANIVAFATNFGVFAIFFFTTLYLAIIAGFSGYRIAVSFLTMAAAMALAASFTGRWVARSGPAVPTVVGCVLAGAGMFLVDMVLTPTVGTGALAWSLGITGLGFGMTLVTATSLVLTIVPPERSGMAASTVNMFRELGGVFGVAILGTIVNGQLTTKLADRLQALGLPHDFQSLVIYALTHGGNLPANAHVSTSAILNHPEIVQQATTAAYQAFGNGLDIALRLAGGILLGAGVVAWLSFRSPQPALTQ